MARTRRRYNPDTAYDPSEDGYQNRDTGRTQHVIRGNSTAVELERRKLMRESGANEDRGQSVADLRTSMRGAVTPQSADIVRLKSRPGARPFTPGVSNPPPVGVQPNRNAESAVAASPATFKTARQMERENAAGTLPVKRAEPVGAPKPARADTGPGAGNRAPFRGSTPEEIADFNANPASAVAGTGRTAQTHYGTVSSRTPKAGEVERQGPSVTTESGVAGQGTVAPLRWDQQIVANHPDIGVAGSEANKAFVAAFNAHRASVPSDAPIDEAHMQSLANSAMEPLYASGTARRAGATPRPSPATAHNDINTAPEAAQAGQDVGTAGATAAKTSGLGTPAFNPAPANKALVAGGNAPLPVAGQPPAIPPSPVTQPPSQYGTASPPIQAATGLASAISERARRTAGSNPAETVQNFITGRQTATTPGAKPYMPLAVAPTVAAPTPPAGATAPAPPGEPLIAGRRTKKPFEF